MSAINSVKQIGRLTRNPEVTYTNGGTAIMKFSIANSYRKKVNGNYQDVAQFFDVVIIGKYAENLSFLAKGLMVGIEGELRYSSWEKDGAKRSKVDILCSNLICLTPKNQNNNQNQRSGNNYNQNQNNNQVPDFEDDIQF